MAQTILEKVMANVLTTLVGAGLKARRPVQTPPPPAAGDVLVYQGNQVSVPWQTAACMKAEWMLDVEVYAFTIESEKTAGGAVENDLAQLAGQIRAALIADHSRGGNALNTRFDKPEEYLQNTSPPGVKVTVTVHYRTAYNDPTSL